MIQRMWLQSRNSSRFSFKNRCSVFPLSLNTLAAHDGRTRGAQTNLRLFYPMFVFPQAVPQHVLGSSQTAPAGHSTPRRSFWWKPRQASLRDREKVNARPSCLCGRTSEVSKRSAPPPPLRRSVAPSLKSH